jgi:hypothetical protein
MPDGQRSQVVDPVALVRMLVAQDDGIEPVDAGGQKAPHLVLYPGIAISLAVFGANLFGDALRDTLDPRLRGA